MCTVSYTHLDVYKRQGLTVEQKISLRDLISAKDGKSQTFEQKIITEFYPEITDGLHTIPTQLRKSLPGLKNAYLKTTYIPVSYTHLDVYKRQDLNT